MGNKLYFYDCWGDSMNRKEALINLSDVFIVSEFKLPPKIRTETWGICPRDCRRISKSHINQTINIVLGDPRNVNGVKYVSRLKKGVPEEIRSAFTETSVDTFEYNGKMIWAVSDYVCLLGDFEKKVAEEKKSA